MMMHTGNLTKRLLAFSALFAVAGCGPLISFGDDGPADAVYTLEYPDTYIGNVNEAATMYVSQPVMTGGLGGREITVSLPGNKQTLLKGVRWANHLSDLLQDYMIRSLRAETHANVISDRGLDVQVNCRLDAKVWTMAFTPGFAPGEDSVEVSMEMSLVRITDAHLIGHPIYSQTVAVQGEGGDSVVAAFNSALNSIAKEYGAWVSENLEACSG